MPTFKNAILNLSDSISAASQSYEASGTFLTAGAAETYILKNLLDTNSLLIFAPLKNGVYVKE